MMTKAKRKTIPGIHISDLEVCSIEVTRPISYSFRFKRGWAIFTINDDTGEFAINSDWGNYSYRWSANPKNLGAPSLTDFLRRTLQRDAAYVIDKFSYTNKADLDPIVDESATRREFKRALASVFRHRRKSKILDHGNVRDAFREIDDIDFESNTSIERSMISDLYHLPDLLPCEWWDLIRHMPSARAVILRHSLLPFFGRHLQQLDDEATVMRTGKAP